MKTVKSQRNALFFLKGFPRLGLFVLVLFCSNACSGIFTRTVRYISYPVQSGDTLYSVSERFDVSTVELEEVNEILNPRELEIGQELLIPYRGQSLQRSSKDLAGSFDKLGKILPRVRKKGSKRVSLGEAGKYAGQLVWPVKGLKARQKISSFFGPRFFSFHEGIDIRSPSGTPVVAAHDGLVVYSGSGYRGYGKLVVLQADQILTVYAHNRQIKVSAGERVNKGDIIAEVGKTGRASGPHLHFETRIRNAQGEHLAVNPLVFYPD